MQETTPRLPTLTRVRRPKVIGWDLWRTLMLSDGEFPKNEPITEIQAVLGYKCAKGGTEAITPDEEFRRVSLTMNEKNPEKFLRALGQRFGCEVGADELEALEKIRQRESSALARYEDVNECLEAMAKRGIKQGLISNICGYAVEEVCAREDLMRFLSHRVYSCEVGVAKPEPQPFLELCRLMDVEPYDVLWVGDHLEHDVRAAQRVGGQVALIDRKRKHPDQIPGVIVLRSLRELPGIIDAAA